MSPAARTERGSTSLELVLLAPALLAVFLLIAAFGRHANVEGYVDQAARDAARTATATRDWGTAKAAVDATVAADLATAPASCRDSATQDVHTTTGTFEASDVYDPTKLNVLTVTVRCNIDMSDLAFIGLGTVRMQSTFSSPIPAIYGTY